MDPTALKQYAPIIKNILNVNIILILYYVLPNLSSFLLTLLLIVLFKPTCLQLSCKSESACTYELGINQRFDSYLNASISKKIMVIVSLGVIVQITYLLPSWLIFFSGAQIIALWQLIVSFGVLQLIACQIAKIEDSINKFLQMIPRYVEKKA